MQIQQKIDQCQAWIEQADGLLITAGAGMGVDSGLPDFRGDEGMWQAYPALGRAKTRFGQIANPASFKQHPQLAWGFYGHRLRLYRETTPHAGFTILSQLGERMPNGYFVFTSNVDGQFQKAGYSEAHIHECHGSIHRLQCMHAQCGAPWSAEGLRPVIDEEHCQWLGPLPQCLECGSLARPNLLMFGDWSWREERYEMQRLRLDRWLQKVERLLVIELGAGVHIPSVRHASGHFAWRLIRVNPRHPELGPTQGHGIGLAIGALEFCQLLQTRL